MQNLIAGQARGCACRARKLAFRDVLLVAVLMSVAVGPSPSAFAQPGAPEPWPVLRLGLSPTAPRVPFNLSPVPASKSLVAGDIAFEQPTFGMSYYSDGYPARATDGTCRAWRTASTSRSWFYVDLGSPRAVEAVVHNLYVDERFTPAPRTQIIASNDLDEWWVVFDETYPRNASHRTFLRTLELKRVVTARYFGLFGSEWSGGWADMYVFALLPPDTPRPNVRISPCRPNNRYPGVLHFPIVSSPPSTRHVQPPSALRREAVTNLGVPADWSQTRHR